MNKRSRHIGLYIIGGIASLGLVLMIIATILGGRMGTLAIQDNELVYQTTANTISLGETPAWVQNLEQTIITLNNRLHRFNPIEFPLITDSSENDNSFTFNGDSSTVQDGQTLDLPSATDIDMHFSYGYVTIQAGDTPSISVSGTLACDVYYADGSLQLSNASEIMNGLSTRQVNGITHFFWNGADITTYYTITVPYHLVDMYIGADLGRVTIQDVQADSFEGYVAVGEMEINGLLANTANLHVETGSITANNLQVTDFTAYTQAGAIQGTGLVSDTVTLNSELGDITFSGTVATDIYASAQVGNIKLSIARPQQYGYDVSVELGAIRIDGQNMANGSSYDAIDGGLMMDLTTQLGNIEVAFT